MNEKLRASQEAGVAGKKSCRRTTVRPRDKGSYEWSARQVPGVFQQRHTRNVGHTVMLPFQKICVVYPISRWYIIWDAEPDPLVYRRWRAVDTHSQHPWFEQMVRRWFFNAIFQGRFLGAKLQNNNWSGLAGKSVKYAPTLATKSVTTTTHPATESSWSATEWLLRDRSSTFKHKKSAYRHRIGTRGSCCVEMFVDSPRSNHVIQQMIDFNNSDDWTPRRHTFPGLMRIRVTEHKPFLFTRLMDKIGTQ